MSIPGISPDVGGAEGVGFAPCSVPDMSIPGISPCGSAEVAGGADGVASDPCSVPDMSIPGISPCGSAEVVGADELMATPSDPWSIPDMADDVDLDANIVTATTPATARTTAKITIRAVPVRRVM